MTAPQRALYFRTQQMGPPKTIVVLTDSGYGKCVVGAAQLAGHVVQAVYTDDVARWGQTMLGIPVLGPLERALDDALPAVVAMTDPGAREAVVLRLALEWTTLIHPRAFLHPSVTVGEGTIFFAGAMAQPGVRIGTHVIVSANVTVAHDCTVEDFVYLAPGVDLAGTVSVGRGALLENGAVVGPNRTIGAGTRIAPRAVVIRDLPEHVAAEGAPARIVRSLV